MSPATIILAHGDAAHAEHYQYAAARLASAGHEVIALDGEPRGEDEAPTRRQYAAALAELDRLLHPTGGRSERPVVLLGNGTDGAVVLRYAIDHQADLAGLILSAPLVTAPLGPIRQWFQHLGATLLPDAPARTEPGQTNPDPVVDTDYFADPLTRLGQIPMSNAAMGAARDAELMAGIDTLTLATLLIWGTRDGLAPSGGAEHLLGALEHTELTRRSLDCPYHEVLSGSAREPALDAVLAWLDQRI